MTEAEIEENAASDPDAPPVPDEELARAGTVLFLEDENGPSHAVPLDPDVAGYFQPLGARQREQINRILRDYIAARRAAG
jgi:uncharacterized protein (DUF4415 family)